VSRDKGNRAPRWVADYIRPWWPLAEALPNGRPGADIENTPGVAFEVKTGVTWRDAWLRQAAKYPGRIRVLVYLPPGCGKTSVASAQAIMPMHVLMQLLKEAGYC
jgi:hypothetical protein